MKRKAQGVYNLVEDHAYGKQAERMGHNKIFKPVLKVGLTLPNIVLKSAHSKFHTGHTGFSSGGKKIDKKFDLN